LCKLRVVDLPIAVLVEDLEEVCHLLRRHFSPQIRKPTLQLPDVDRAIAILIERSEDTAQLST